MQHGQYTFNHPPPPQQQQQYGQQQQQQQQQYGQQQQQEAAALASYFPGGSPAHQPPCSPLFIPAYHLAHTPSPSQQQQQGGPQQHLLLASAGTAALPPHQAAMMPPRMQQQQQQFFPPHRLSPSSGGGPVTAPEHAAAAAAACSGPVDMPMLDLELPPAAADGDGGGGLSMSWRPGPGVCCGGLGLRSASLEAPLPPLLSPPAPPPLALQLAPLPTAAPHTHHQQQLLLQSGAEPCLGGDAGGRLGAAIPSGGLRAAFMHEHDLQQQHVRRPATASGLPDGSGSSSMAVTDLASPLSPEQVAAEAAAAAAVPDAVRLVPGSSSSSGLLGRGSSMRSYSFSGGECLSPTAAATATKAAVSAAAAGGAAPGSDGGGALALSALLGGTRSGAVSGAAGLPGSSSRAPGSVQHAALRGGPLPPPGAAAAVRSSLSPMVPLSGFAAGGAAGASGGSGAGDIGSPSAGRLMRAGCPSCPNVSDLSHQQQQQHPYHHQQHGPCVSRHSAGAAAVPTSGPHSAGSSHLQRQQQQQGQAAGQSHSALLPGVLPWQLQEPVFDLPAFHGGAGGRAGDADADADADSVMEDDSDEQQHQQQRQQQQQRRMSTAGPGGVSTPASPLHWPAAAEQQQQEVRREQNAASPGTAAEAQQRQQQQQQHHGAPRSPGAPGRSSSGQADDAAMEEEGAADDEAAAAAEPRAAAVAGAMGWQQGCAPNAPAGLNPAGQQQGGGGHDDGRRGSRSGRELGSAEPVGVGLLDDLAPDDPLRLLLQQMAGGAAGAAEALGVCLNCTAPLMMELDTDSVDGGDGLGSMQGISTQQGQQQGGASGVEDAQGSREQQQQQAQVDAGGGAGGSIISDVLCSSCGHRQADDASLMAGQLPPRLAASAAGAGRPYVAAAAHAGPAVRTPELSRCAPLLAFDEGLLRHAPPHDSSHPERPERAAAVMARLVAAGLAGRCRRIPCRKARVEELSAVHDLALIREVATASKLQQQEAEAAAAAAHSQQQQQQQQCPQSPAPLASPAAGEARSAMCSPVLDTSSSQQRLPPSPLSSHGAAGLQPASSAAAAAAAAAGGLALPPGSHFMPPATAADDTSAGVSHGSELGASHILDCYLSPATYSCAAMAAGGAIDVAVAVARGEAPCGAAIIRPPGHHAEGGLAMGFCYFNNAAVAARAAQSVGAHRVVVLDWDVHHGNGSQAIFEEDPSVLYVSLHRYDRGNFFPGTGHVEEVGCGAGSGACVNVAWDGPGPGDADYLAAFSRVLLPILYEFAPHLIIVSAGFDAAHGDPLGGCHVSPACYGHMTALLQPVAPTVLLLEGGYNLAATSASVEACVRVLLGEPPARLAGPLIPTRVGLAGIQAALAVQARHWRCLGGVPLPPSSGHPLLSQPSAAHSMGHARHLPHPTHVLHQPGTYQQQQQQHSEQQQAWSQRAQEPAAPHPTAQAAGAAAGGANDDMHVFRINSIPPPGSNGLMRLPAVDMAGPPLPPPLPQAMQQHLAAAGGSDGQQRMEYGPEPPPHQKQQQQANGVASPGSGMQQPEVLPVFGPQPQPSQQQQQQQSPANGWSTHQQQQQTPGRSPAGAGCGPARQHQQAWPQQQQQQQANAVMQQGQCHSASPCSAVAVAPAASAGDGVFAIAGSGGSGSMVDPFAAAAGWSFIGAPLGDGPAAAAAGGGSLSGPAGGVCSMFRDNSVSSPPTEQLLHGQAGALGGGGGTDGALLAAFRRQLQAEGVGASGEMPLSAAPTLSSTFSM